MVIGSKSNTCLKGNFFPLLLHVVIGTFFFSIYQVKSQTQIKFRQLSTKDGLSQNSAISVVQDSVGFLWVATQDGLNKYDGNEFSTYPFNFTDITKPDYSNLGKVYVDRKGEVWIIPTNKVPYRYNPSKNTFEPVAGVKDASTILMGPDNNIYIGTNFNGLYIRRGDEENFRQFTPNLLEGKPIFNMVINKQGWLLLATEGAILVFDPETNEIKSPPCFNADGEPIVENFSDIVVDKRGGEWLATFGGGLYYREHSEGSLQRVSSLPFEGDMQPDLNILDLHIDSKGRLWVGTYGNGLYLINLDQYSISHFKAEKHNPTAIHYNDILSIHEDYTGTLWFGTDGAGLSYYDEYLEKFNSFTDVQMPEDIHIDVVRAITVDKAKRIWIGTSGKGLTRYDPQNEDWKTFKTKQGDNYTIASDRIMSLLSDDEDDLWIGTQGEGLDIIKKNGQLIHWSTRSYNYFEGNTIWCIFQDSDKDVWLGTRENGLVKFDKRKGQLQKYEVRQRQSDGIPNNNVRVIVEDDQGNLWIGTELDGIAQFDKNKGVFKSYQHLNKSESPARNHIKSLYYSPKGILWIGTNGAGLTAFEIRSKVFHEYGVKDGLANNVIYAVLPDDRGNLWLSSNKGISKFTPGASLEDSPKVVNYTNYEGLGLEFNTGASFKDGDGNLYFGGLDGFYWFRPSDIRLNTILPKTTIIGMEIFNKPHPLQKGVALESDQNTILFTFSSMQYSLPEKNRYQYRLLNFDNEWVTPGSNNFARYSNLPPGNYEFQVISSNYDGVWNHNPVVYTFSIKSPWYFSLSAKVVYLCLLFLMLYGIYAYLQWRWKMRLDLQLQIKEAERFKKLNDFKSQLYTNISHEFRTPLTLISGPIDLKLTQGGLSDTDYAIFSMIKKNTGRLIHLVDQLLDLAKLEKGRLKLSVSKGDLGLFLKILASSFEQRLVIKKMEYRVEVQEIGNVWYDWDALEKIVTNLLSNAFKYGKEGGICHLKAQRIEGKVHISVKNSVKDNFDLEEGKIFSRFYQQDVNAEGAGIGLPLVKELVLLHNGNISVRMETDNIINFSLTLPINMADFPKDTLVESADLGGGKILEDNNSGRDFGLEYHRKNVVNNRGEPPIILVVDNHLEVRQFLELAWKDKFQLHQAENGKQGLEKALKIIPDLVITDIRMPVLNGIELCNTLKADERTSHIPIIFLTAGKGEELELQGLKSGADDFIAKPFKLSILQVRVENLLETRRLLRNRYSHEIILKAKDIAFTRADEVFLNRIQKVLDVHLANPQFNASFFCKVLGLSRMQLHRKLIAYTGLSTTAFIRSQRLKQSLKILKNSDATVNEVAYAVGFNTPSYFIKCFKEAFKKSPMEYIQEYRN